MTQLGSSLIEVLISLFLISIMLISLDAIQLSSLKETQNTYYFSVANERIHALREIISANAVETLMSQWDLENKNMLPNGRGMLTDDMIIVFWGKNNLNNCEKIKLGQDGCLFIKTKG